MNAGTNASDIYVNMLGEFSIKIGSKAVSDRNNQAKKPWILLEYLITFRNRSISQSELIELIWGSDDSTNPGGALKTLMFRSRQLLTPLDYPVQQLIIQQRGAYSWNPELSTMVDIDLFEAFSNKGLDSDLDTSQQITYCLKALQLYKGDFLAKSAWESWVIPISTYYHTLYQKVAHHVIQLLLARKDYIQIVEICQKATRIDPFDENLHYDLILALYRPGKQHAALEHYNYTIDMLYSEFAITPSEHLKSLYKEIRDTARGVTTDLSVIQDSLEEEDPSLGAYCCEYSVFKDIYRLESRAIERSGDSIYLCLLTLTDSDGIMLASNFLNKGMEALGDAICSSLRRGDAYSRYSVSQYMVLLPTATYEDGVLVLKRIIQDFHRLYTRKNILVNYSLQTIRAGKTPT
ncbi:MAG: BTAD domain-containing putative transcriptional regulator [Hungatella sp.]